MKSHRPAFGQLVGSAAVTYRRAPCPRFHTPQMLFALLCNAASQRHNRTLLLMPVSASLTTLVRTCMQIRFLLSPLSIFSATLPTRACRCYHPTVILPHFHASARISNRVPGQASRRVPKQRAPILTLQQAASILNTRAPSVAPWSLSICISAKAQDSTVCILRLLDNIALSVRRRQTVSNNIPR